MELFRDILTFQRFGCVKYLSDASYFATLVLRTTLSTGTKQKKREVVEGKQAEQKVFQTHRIFVSHRVPCQLLLPRFTRPPPTLPLPTVHLFPYASLSLSGHALFLTLLLSPKDQSGF